MWHHEDAGIGFNVFRAVVRANATAVLVPVPGHYNDPGVIERSASPQDAYWSSRAVFVHGIKARCGCCSILLQLAAAAVARVANAANAAARAAANAAARAAARAATTAAATPSPMPLPSPVPPPPPELKQSLALKRLLVPHAQAAVHFDLARNRWSLQRSMADAELRCGGCSLSGPDGYHWGWARLPCTRRPFHEPQLGRFCDVVPQQHFRRLPY